MLTTDQMQAMYEDGYIALRQLLTPDQIAQGLHTINNHLGDHGMDPAELQRYRAASYCPDLREAPILTDLFSQTAIASACGELVGEGNLLPIERFQIALRFPRPYGSIASPPHGHLDGLGTGTNGIPKGTYTRGFTGLCVVLLSDLPEPDMGNFTVWPGSHRQAEAYFKQHGHTGLKDGGPKLDELAEPVQITGKAGDVVLTHHMIIHTAAGNASPHIRYAIITRFRHAICPEFAEGAFTDMWREWEGLRAVVEESRV